MLRGIQGPLGFVSMLSTRRASCLTDARTSPGDSYRPRVQFCWSLVYGPVFLLPVTKTRTTGYHPCSNGPIKCMNRQLLQMV